MASIKSTAKFLVALGVCGILAWWAWSLPAPIQYDTKDSDYGWMEKALNGADPGQGELDFSKSSFKGWQIACLFGPYRSPQDALAARGFDVSVVDKQKMDEKSHMGLRLATVEEGEAVVVIALKGHPAHFIHFKRALSQYHELGEICIKPPETKLRF